MSIDLEAIEAQFNRATPVEFVVLAGRYLPVLFMECKRQAEQLSSVTAERDAAVECINVTEDRLTRIADAAEYVKPNTGIWHTVHIALYEIKQWRGAGKEQNNESLS